MHNLQDLKFVVISSEGYVAAGAATHGEAEQRAEALLERNAIGAAYHIAEIRSTLRAVRRVSRRMRTLGSERFDMSEWLKGLADELGIRLRRFVRAIRQVFP